MAEVIMDGMSVAPATFFRLAAELDRLLEPFDGTPVYNATMGGDKVIGLDSPPDSLQVAVETAKMADEVMDLIFNAPGQPATWVGNDAAVVE